jgi:hypothetical protein
MTEILFRNDQWMVQDEPRGKFIMEVLEHAPDDTENGYWIGMEDLMHITECHRMIVHVCEKTWVDIDAFEQAVLYAFLIFGLRPSYDLHKEFAAARKSKLTGHSPFFTDLMNEMIA